MHGIGMCHVLTVFTFTESVSAATISKSICFILRHICQATYAYRSIAEFVKHVTSHSAEHLERNPFPELHLPPAEISESSSENAAHRDRGVRGAKMKHPLAREITPDDIQQYRANEETAKDEVDAGEAERMSRNGDSNAESGEVRRLHTTGSAAELTSRS